MAINVPSPLPYATGPGFVIVQLTGLATHSPAKIFPMLRKKVADTVWLLLTIQGPALAVPPGAIAVIVVPPEAPEANVYPICGTNCGVPVTVNVPVPSVGTVGAIDPVAG